MIRFRHKGKFDKTIKWFNRMKQRTYLNQLAQYGQIGVKALAEYTPKDSGKTASSWTYSIGQEGNGYVIAWSNSNVNNGVNIAVILQHGHGTGTGGYVQGIDYINPALRSVFNDIANAAWKEVCS